MKTSLVWLLAFSMLATTTACGKKESKGNGSQNVQEKVDVVDLPPDAPTGEKEKPAEDKKPLSALDTLRQALTGTWKECDNGSMYTYVFGGKDSISVTAEDFATLDCTGDGFNRETTNVRYVIGASQSDDTFDFDMHFKDASGAQETGVIYMSIRLLGSELQIAVGDDKDAKYGDGKTAASRYKFSPNAAAVTFHLKKVP